MLIKKVVVEKANRLFQLPPELASFARPERIRSLIRKGEVIDLAGFSWPAPPLETVTGSPFKAASGDQINQLKAAIAAWFSAAHGVTINPTKEIFIGDGVSRMLLTLSLAFVDHGDIVFVPELGLPLYRQVAAACGAEPVTYALPLRNDWQPDFERVASRLGRVARVLFLNSPHNPTGAELSSQDLANLVWLAGREHIVLVNDAAYASISGRKPVSMLSVSGGKKVGVEAYSFAYNFGLPGVPFGFVAGNREVISGMRQAAALTRTFIPEAYIAPAVEALRQYPHDRLLHVRRRFEASAAEGGQLLTELGLEKAGFDAVPFLWARVDRRRDALRIAELLYRRYRLLTLPGTAFGEPGEGFVRFSLSAPVEAYRTARERVARRWKMRSRKTPQ